MLIISLDMNILFEDDYIIVCEKPAGIATQAGKITDKDMVSEVNNYLRRAGAKASAYLIHRLDKPVRGILVFAKTKQAAAGLNKQITNGDFCKKYFAIVEGCPEKEEGTLVNYIYKDSKLSRAVIASNVDEELRAKENLVMVENENTNIKGCANKTAANITKNSDVKLAKLEYKLISKYSGEALLPQSQSTDVYLLDVHLLTGRFHQIRCQLSNFGHPIIGDSLYGAKLAHKKRNAIGLTAYSLSFKHPITNEELSFGIDIE